MTKGKKDIRKWITKSELIINATQQSAHNTCNLQTQVNLRIWVNCHTLVKSIVLFQFYSISTLCRHATNQEFVNMKSHLLTGKSWKIWWSHHTASEINQTKSNDWQQVILEFSTIEGFNYRLQWRQIARKENSVYQHN